MTQREPKVKEIHVAQPSLSYNTAFEASVMASVPVRIGADVFLLGEHGYFRIGQMVGGQGEAEVQVGLGLATMKHERLIWDKLTAAGFTIAQRVVADWLTDKRGR